MSIKVDSSKCTGCGICLAICPVGAIKIDETTKKAIITSDCISCGACIEECIKEHAIINE